MRREQESSEKTERKIYLRPELFEMIKAGTKTLEVRVAFASFQKIQEGQKIIFCSPTDEEVPVEITHKRFYRSLEEVLQGEDMTKLVPGASIEEIKKLAARIFKEHVINQNGILVFEFKKLDE